MAILMADAEIGYSVEVKCSCGQTHRLPLDASRTLL